MPKSIFSKGFINPVKFLKHSENLLLLLGRQKILGLLKSYILAEGMLDISGNSAGAGVSSSSAKILWNPFYF